MSRDLNMKGTVEEQLKKNVTELGPDDCWIYGGFISKEGYGKISGGGKHYFAHRVSYSLYKGEIPKGLIICHICDNKKCVNPNHLYAGTNLDNQQDRRIADGLRK